jgi:hypothetical protein
VDYRDEGGCSANFNILAWQSWAIWLKRFHLPPFGHNSSNHHQASESGIIENFREIFPMSQMFHIFPHSELMSCKSCTSLLFSPEIMQSDPIPFTHVSYHEIIRFVKLLPHPMLQPSQESLLRSKPLSRLTSWLQPHIVADVPIYIL